MKIKIIFCYLFMATSVPLLSHTENTYDKKHNTHHDARKLRTKAYSALYWLILSSVLYYKAKEDYPWVSVVCAVCALDRGVAMVHYFHEAHCCTYEEEKSNAAT